MELKKSRISGFYEERDGNGELVGISAMNMGSMCKEGECYEYQYGRIVRVCEYKSGEFVRVLKDIHGSTMTEYDENGNKVYEGEFDDRIENGLKRKGKGMEYEKDGKTLVYVGDWSNGKKNGYGVLYKNSEVVYKGEWENGEQKKVKKEVQREMKVEVRNRGNEQQKKNDSCGIVVGICSILFLVVWFGIMFSLA